MSVTALRIFWRIASGSSIRSIVPSGDVTDFDIFRSGCCRSITLRGDLRHLGLGDDEGLAVTVVEANRDVPGELEVLALVVADRHLVGVVEEDVGGHQRPGR